MIEEKRELLRLIWRLPTPDAERADELLSELLDELESERDRWHARYKLVREGIPGVWAMRVE